MRLEDRLRDTFQLVAAHVEPEAPPVDELHRRALLRRARQRRAAGAVAVAVAAIVALVLAVLVPEVEERRVEAGPATATDEPAEATASAGFPGIWPEWDRVQYERSARGAAAGAGAWRLDAVEVARRYALERLRVEGADMGAYEPFDAQRGQVSFRHAGGSGTVIVERPGGAGEPFVVAEATADGLTAVPRGAGSTRGIVPAGALRDPIFVDVWSKSGGEGVARVGNFDSQWLTQTSFRVAAGASTTIMLDLDPPLPGALLVRVEMPGRGRILHVAEFRVDGGAPVGAPQATEPALAQGELVALTSSGVAVLAADGTAVRQIAREADIGQGASHLAVSPDGRRALFSRALTGCSSEVVSVPIAGGPVDVLGPGRAAAMSPDGTALAVAVDADCAQSDSIVVTDLRTGAKRVWRGEATSALPAVVRSLSWSPDGTRLAFELVLEDGREVRILDVDGDGGRVEQARKLAAPAGRSWSQPAFDRRGNIVVAELSGDERGRATPVSVVALDPATGNRQRSLSLGTIRLRDLAVSVRHDEVLALAIGDDAVAVWSARRVPGTAKHAELAW